MWFQNLNFRHDESLKKLATPPLSNVAEKGCDHRNKVAEEDFRYHSWEIQELTRRAKQHFRFSEQSRFFSLWKNKVSCSLTQRSHAVGAFLYNI
jgi:hypothetical protein